MGLIEARDSSEAILHPLFKAVGDTVHPNVITSVRLPIGVATLVMRSANWTVAAVTTCVANAVLDWLDGAAARASGKTSAVGARLDPLVDKLVNGVQLSFLAAESGNLALQVSVAVNVLINIISQRLRGPVIPQLMEGFDATLHPEKYAGNGDSKDKANTAGKVKTIIECLVIIVLFLSTSDDVSNASAGALGVASAFGLTGVIKRILASRDVGSSASPIQEENPPK